MSSLDSILNQIKFAGVPAKFSGATRPMLVQVVFNPAFLDLGSFPQQLLNALQYNEWSVQGDDIQIGEVDVAGSTREIVYFTANVESQYTADQVQSAIMAVFAAMNITVDSVSVSGSTAPLTNPGNVYGTGTKPITTKPPVVQPNQVPNATATANSKSWFDRTFFTGAGTISGVGIGILLVIGVVAVTSSQRK